MASYTQKDTAQRQTRRCITKITLWRWSVIALVRRVIHTLNAIRISCWNHSIEKYLEPHHGFQWTSKSRITLVMQGSKVTNLTQSVDFGESIRIRFETEELAYRCWRNWWCDSWQGYRPFSRSYWILPHESHRFVPAVRLFSLVDEGKLIQAGVSRRSLVCWKSASQLVISSLALGGVFKTWAGWLDLPIDFG